MSNKLSDLHMKMVDRWGEVWSGSFVMKLVGDETGGWESGSGNGSIADGSKTISITSSSQKSSNSSH